MEILSGEKSTFPPLLSAESFLKRSRANPVLAWVNFSPAVELENTLDELEANVGETEKKFKKKTTVLYFVGFREIRN